MLTNFGVLARYKTGVAIEHLNEYIMFILLFCALIIDGLLIYFNNDLELNNNNKPEDIQKKYKLYYNKYLGALLNSGKWIYKLDEKMKEVWNMNFNRLSPYVEAKFKKYTK